MVKKWSSEAAFIVFTSGGFIIEQMYNILPKPTDDIASYYSA